MTATRLIVELLGEIALLLWGIHMVHSGMLRAFGGGLRRALAVGLRRRVSAFLAGLGVTTVLQSSTATGLMVTSFAAAGSLELVPALAAMLGANVGTTLIVQAMSFDITLLFPPLVFGGLIAFRRGRRGRTRDLGRAAIGLGLMLVALHLLAASMAPVETAPVVRDLLHRLTGDPVLNLALAAVLTWAAHSSVASMLFIMSLASAGAVPTEAALAMVLGANLGSALNPLLEAGAGARGAPPDPARRRLPLGNLANRVVGCLVALPLLHPAATWLAGIDGNPARIAANFHTLFNVATALVFILPLPLVARLLRRLLPEAVAPSDPGTPQYLDEAALDTPSVALSNAARETLRMVDVVEAMLRGSHDAFHTDDRRRVQEISRMDDILDQLHRALHHYLAAISREALGDEEARRVAEILAFAINLEHVGDILDKNLMELAAKRIRLRLRLSPEGRAEIDDMHDRLIDHLHLAVAVFMLRDAQAARRLVEEKDRFRARERAAARGHFERVREGRRESIETSGLMLDIIRDLKRIEAHIAATAYPLLERRGELKPSRLAV